MVENRVTIGDVARRAGLSVATVSRVMHDSPRVSAAARQRVRAAVETLGYTPNALARGLAMNSTSHIVGVLLSSIADPFWAQVACGIEDYAHSEHYAVLIAGSYEDTERERSAFDLFQYQRVDGIIVGASSAGLEMLHQRRTFGLPVIFVNNEHIEPDDLTSNRTDGDSDGLAPGNSYLVANDDVQGAMLATAHLLELGHQCIAYIGPPGRASSVRRCTGYRQALERAGMTFDEDMVAIVGEGANAGELGAFRLLARPSAPTALFCYDDMTALGALRAVRALNRRVPHDVSVVGFDDIPLAAYLDPPLTTVRQPMYEMGRQAMHTVLDLLQGQAPPHAITMPGELVVRRSSGGAPPAVVQGQ